MAVSTMTRETKVVNELMLQKNYLTTTELAKLCGVSRFTIRNWIKQGRIKAVRTIGKQYRIPVSEAISFLETMHRETTDEPRNGLAAGALRHCWEYPQKTSCDNECKNCLIFGKESDYCFIVVRQFGKGVIRCQGDCLNCDYFGEFFGFYSESSQVEEPLDDKSKKTAVEKKKFLYNFAYSVGRGVHVLKRKE